MSQHPNPSEPQGISAPIISAANRVSVTMQPTDITLSMGVTRLAFNPTGVQVGAAVEYVGAYSLSPTTAKQLGEILRITVAKYEQQFGTIPMDPASVQRFKDIEEAPFAPKKTRAKAAPKTAAKTVRAKR